MRILSFFVFFLFSYSAHSNTLLILGDSLSAGYNMSAEQSWPTLLEPILNKQGTKISIINASISGDTTGNGLARLSDLLNQHQPQTVLIELGANDGLRGFPPKMVTNNLTSMITKIKNSGANPVLMQIFVPPNYGQRYSKAFSSIYPQISSQHNVPLVPFFLEYIITKPEWMMDDGLHPKPEAQPWIAQFMATELTPYL